MQDSRYVVADHWMDIILTDQGVELFWKYYLMKGYEHPDQKLLVFCFQWKGKPVDDGPKDLKKLPNSVEVFRFVDELHFYTP